MAQQGQEALHGPAGSGSSPRHSRVRKLSMAQQGQEALHGTAGSGSSPWHSRVRSSTWPSMVRKLSMSQQGQELSMSQQGQEVSMAQPGQEALHGTASSVREPKALSENYMYISTQQAVNTMTNTSTACCQAIFLP